MEPLAWDSMAFISCRWMRMLVPLASALSHSGLEQMLRVDPCCHPWPFQKDASAVSATPCFSAPETHDDSPLALWDLLSGDLSMQHQDPEICLNPRPALSGLNAAFSNKSSIEQPLHLTLAGWLLFISGSFSLPGNFQKETIEPSTCRYYRPQPTAISFCS